MGFIPQMIETINKTDQAVVLAQIVHVDGSAYRKEGAWMFFTESGSKIGILSGGCLESDLHNRASDLFHTKKVEVCEFDLSSEDDLGWGRGAGCNGVVTVLLRDVDHKFKNCLLFLHEQLQQKRCVTFLQELEGDYNYLFSSETNTIGTLPTHKVCEDLHAFQQVAGRRWIEDVACYYQVIWPKPSLYLFGAGADARPFAALAATVGYSVHVCDWRQSLCSDSHFPAAASLRTGKIEELVKNITFHPLDSVVIMTHDFQVDKHILQRLQDEQLLYIGLLGSRKRTTRLVGGEIPGWLNSPIGLSIGAEGPQEIAVSIIAQMISVRRRAAIWPSLASI
ncbi:XdhC family protein [Sporosarcina highlanderae]|uniref:XdhC family protein n=1 Tax=Sporosarcina highlanderae TaxID=3035916 RepID=A0ABT8JRG7_9BACL|nr:XdhC family protein [Sporosarcina highlanderae]MDN4607617.1 XdhC family protein [Sporosarcina highlanderae]